MNHYDALRAPKALATAPRWKLDDRGHFRFQAPLMVDGVVREGLYLLGRAPESTPSRDVAFMFCNGESKAKSVVIDRIDWNPTASHANRNIGPEELRLLVIDGSHRHLFEDNLTSSGELRSGNLPVARPIVDNLNTFGRLVAFAEEAYNIASLGDLAPPLWIEDLFG